MQHHGAALRALGVDEELIEDLATGWRQAELPERLRALAAYAEKLTLSPGEVEEADVEALRGAGLSDEAVLHACEVVAYYNFVNRTAEGLGVALEEAWDRPIVGELRGEG
ncbi:MAG: carboxymuconolactone decarboxylase family protein [Gemmatimonadota bacterium]